MKRGQQAAASKGSSSDLKPKKAVKPPQKAADSKEPKQQPQETETELEQLLGHRLPVGAGGMAPLDDDYVAPAQKSASSSSASASASLNEFAGVRVTRGTLAVFGDDTAKQFALHIDKMLREGRGGSAAGKGKEQITSLLVKHGDVSARAAVLRNDAVPLFEQQMSTLLNASLRQREIRQRDEDDDGKTKEKDDDDDDENDDDENE